MPVLLPGESHGQRSLVGYGPDGHKELDTTEVIQHTAHCEVGVFISAWRAELNEIREIAQSYIS